MARQEYEFALTLYSQLGDRYWQIYVAGHLSAVLLALDQVDTAIALLEAGEQLALAIDGHPNLDWLREKLAAAKARRA